MSTAVHDSPSQTSFLDTEGELVPQMYVLDETESEPISDAPKLQPAELAKIALLRFDALKDLCEASRLENLIDRLGYDQTISNKYSFQQIQIRRAMARRAFEAGNESLRRAEEMRLLAEGICDDAEAMGQMIESGNREFRQTYVGPANEQRRRKYRRELEADMRSGGIAPAPVKTRR